MKRHGLHPAWRRLVAVVSVLAVALGLAPHDLTAGGRGPSLTPPPLPELRAAPAAPLPVPHENGELPVLPALAALVPLAAPLGRARSTAGFAPDPRRLSGQRQLEGG